MERCFYQIFETKEKIPIEGVGYCKDCKPDKNNKNCKGYFPINVTEKFIKEKGLEEKFK
jgi:hypothetical protein